MAGQPSDDLAGRGVLVGVGAKCASQLTHQCRGRDPAPGNVADGHVEDPVGPAHDVVPVPADIQPGGTCLVAAGQVEPTRRRKLLRQQALLQHRRHFVLSLVVTGARERLRCLLGLRGDDCLLVLVQGPLAPEQQRQGAGGAASGRRERHGIHGSHAAGERVAQVREPRAKIRSILEGDRAFRLSRVLEQLQ